MSSSELCPSAAVACTIRPEPVLNNNKTGDNGVVLLSPCESYNLTCVIMIASFPEVMVSHRNVVIARTMELWYQIKPYSHFVAAIMALHLRLQR